MMACFSIRFYGSIVARRLADKQIRFCTAQELEKFQQNHLCTAFEKLLIRSEQDRRKEIYYKKVEGGRTATWQGGYML